MPCSRIVLCAVLLLAGNALSAQTITPFVPTALPGANPPPAPAPAGNPRGDAGSNDIDRHTLNLKGADINVLIQTVSEITGRSFIVDPRVDGKVTVISARPMSPEQVWSTFESVLRVNGFAVVPSGGMYKVVPEGLAAADGGVGNSGSSPDSMVTRVIAVRQVPAAELVALLRPLVPSTAQLAAQGNALVITDRAGNVERIERLIARIDTPANTGVEVLQLRHANASEVVRTLAQLEPQATAGTSGNVVADARTNSVLLSGDPGSRLRLRTLVAHLDTPLSEGDATQVVYLKYAKAADLVEVLEQVSNTLTGTASKSEGAHPVSIQVHEETNSLIITAAPSIFRELSSVVTQLDIRRAQVMVEAVIAEVSDDLADELGVQFQSTSLDNRADGSVGTGIIGGTNLPIGASGGIIAAAQNPLSVGSGLNLGFVDGTVRLPIGENGALVDVLQLGVLIRALRGDSRANILSQPSIITLDHHEAEFKVAQEVPFITGQFTNTGSGGSTQPQNPFQTIDRKDVGLILRVTPHVNEGDAVRLDIVQEVSSLLPQVQGAADLITNKREIRTSVMIPDGGLLVLGGLTSEEVGESVQGVPGLSRIPILGNLFKTRKTTRSRRTLMVFLRPYILRDAAAEAALTNEKYNYLRNEQMRMRERYDGKIRGGDLPSVPENSNDLFTRPPAAPYLNPAQPGAAQPAAQPAAAPSAAQPVENPPNG
ncbi:MAG: type II secretion system secretin GspD [Xanthomonadaceae bacterium]|nr:type II secretion system secretin GspD [Xanthomonadaceae bacterium]